MKTTKEKDKYITADDQIRLQQLILNVARQNFPDFYTGGCTPFYSVKSWKERGEEYGLNSKLIVVYDGGDLRHFFHYGSEATNLYERMRKALNDAGYYWECCTCWYAAIYKKD